MKNNDETVGADPAQTNQRLHHVNAVLKAIRRVNQLIAAEDDPLKLIEKACPNLTDETGYYNTWIALLGGKPARRLGLQTEKPVAAFAGAGAEEGFEPLKRQLKAGNFPKCMKMVLDQKAELLVIGNPFQDCPDCPLSGKFGDRAGLACRLEHDGVVWGILVASVPGTCRREPEEQELFHQMAGDLAFALHKISLRRELEQSREKLRQIIGNSTNMFYEHAPDGTLTYVSPQVQDILGYDAEEARGCWKDLVTDHPENAIGAERTQAAIDTGKAQPPYELQLRHKDGHPVWVDVHEAPVVEKGKTVSISGSLSDVTERKAAEKRVADLARFPEENKNPVFRMDRKGRVLYANAPAKHLLPVCGPDPDPETAAEWLPFVEQALSSGLHLERTSCIASRTFSFTLVPIPDREYVNLYALDITDLKQAEQEREHTRQVLLRQNRSLDLHNRIAEVFLNSSGKEMYADVLDVLINFFDSSFGYFGYINEEGDLVCPSMTRAIWDQCQVPDKSITFPRNVWGGLWGQSLLEERTLVANEGLNVPQGHVPLQNALATPILHQGILLGQVVIGNREEGYGPESIQLMEAAATAIAPVLFSILEEARREAQTEQLEAQLLHAQKMEAVGRLAGGVAHDFNNMLSVILMHADLMLLDLPGDSSCRKGLEEIRNAATRSADLTRQLLAFARKQSVIPKIIDLNETVGGMLKMLQKLMGENIDMIWKPGNNILPVKIDPSQVDQILANLCVNARDAIEDVGEVTIETRTARFSDEDSTDQGVAEPGDYTVLSVSDSGCGFDPEDAAMIFEPFYTTKEIGKGTGLGLATVYGAVKQNGGFIDVTSNPGEGATFTIYLPCQMTAPEHSAEADSDTHSPSQQTTILLVEDETAILHLARMILEQHGYDVLSASTPGEALRLAAEHTGSLHLLITDVIMPEMNGKNLAGKVLHLFPEIKCLFMSGYTGDVIAQHGLQEEGTSFLQKPFSEKTLIRNVQEILQCSRSPYSSRGFS